MIQRGLLTLVCVAPLVAFGGAYRWFTLPLLLLTSCALAASARRAVESGRRQRALDLALLAGCALIALQLLPLPVSVVDAMSPHAARVRGALRLDAPLAADAWVPLSTDREATLHALGVALSAVFAFWAARGTFKRGGVRRWCGRMAWVGLAVALAAVAQRALSPTRIYGIWPPEDPNGQPFGPFVNRNHFAAWLLMTAFVVAGYAAAHASAHLGSGPRQWRRLLRIVTAEGTLLYVSAALVMATTVAITLSRSAMVGLAGGAVLAVLVVRRRMGRLAPTHIAAAAAVTAAGIVLVTGFVDAGRIAERLDDTMRQAPDSRLVIWRESAPLLRDFALTGVGAGAYGSAMLLYEPAGAPVHFNQAHSHYLQVAVEGGALLALPWLVAAALFAVHATRSMRQDASALAYVRLGALVGVAAIAVQSIWETPLRMGANAVLFAVLCGVVLHRRERR